MESNQLHPRHQAILTEIIRYYLASHEAVSARSISKISQLMLSPTSIRNLMEDLSQAGYLSFLSQGKGRIPTQKAFYVYVDSLLDIPTAQPCQPLKAKEGEPLPTLEGLLGAAGEALAERTGHTALAQLPGRESYPLAWVRFARVDEKRVALVLSTRFGDIWSKVLESHRPPPEPILTQLERHLCRHYQGMALAAIREEIMSGSPRQVLEEATSLGDAFRWLKNAFVWQAGRPMRIWREENLFGMEGLAPKALCTLHGALRTTPFLDSALASARPVDGGLVAIGSEITVGGLEQASVVAFPFGAGDWRATLAVLGPMNMDYGLVLQQVRQEALQLSNNLQTLAESHKTACP